MSQSRKDFIKRLGIGFTAISGFNFIGEPELHPRIKPKMLKRGDTIGMISPASNLSEEKKYAQVISQIKNLGFKVKVGSHIKDHYGYLAGKDEDRAADLNAMFADPDVDAVLPFRGGWGSNRILSLIDYKIIKENPKPLIGFSDITSLLLAIYAKTGLITFHGPVGKSEWTTFTRAHFEKVLMQNKSLSISDNNDTINTITEGEASGVLLGGNLSVLTSMLGSKYLPDWQGSILFLEDIGEDIYRVDRMITQLKLNGILDKIYGFIFGKCTSCEVSSGFHFTLEQMLKDHIKRLEIPAFIGANIGHIDDMLTLPIGIRAKMNAVNGSISLAESPVNTLN